MFALICNRINQSNLKIFYFEVRKRQKHVTYSLPTSLNSVIFKQNWKCNQIRKIRKSEVSQLMENSLKLRSSKKLYECFAQGSSYHV